MILRQGGCSWFQLLPVPVDTVATAPKNTAICSAPSMRAARARAGSPGSRDSPRARLATGWGGRSPKGRNEHRPPSIRTRRGPWWRSWRDPALPDPGDADLPGGRGHGPAEVLQRPGGRLGQSMEGVGLAGRLRKGRSVWVRFPIYTSSVSGKGCLPHGPFHKRYNPLRNLS